MNTDQKIRHIANHYGFESQSRQLMEECGELTQAVNKAWRAWNGIKDPLRPLKFEEAKNNLVEEIADVSIMIKQLQTLLGISDGRVTDQIVIKLDREIERIQNGA